MQSLSESKGRLGWLLDLRRTDREMFEYRVKEVEADFQARALLKSIVAAERAPSPDKAAIDRMNQELRSIVALRQSARLALQTLELARIEERVAKIRESIRDHAVNNDKILSEEIESMLSRARESGRQTPRSKDQRPQTEGGSPTLDPQRHHKPAPIPRAAASVNDATASS